jgi:hypothetical protein
MPKLCPKLIFEGTRLTFKTELAFALNEHPRVVGPRKYRYHSPVVSGEWCGFTNQPWGRGLINFQAGELEWAMDTYRAWVNLFEHLPYYSWMVDRFHISTALFQRQVHGLTLDFDWLEQRLVRLGFRLVLLTRAPASFEAARQRRLKVSGNPKQYDDLEPFIAEQEAFRAAVKKTRLPHVELDMTENDVPAAADRVADWLEATGGLYAPDGLIPSGPGPQPAGGTPRPAV